MAIDSPQAINFCNGKARVMADALAQAYYSGVSFLDAWNAEVSPGVTVANLIPDSADLILDGADVDGRPIIDGNAINLLKQRVQTLVDDYEASSDTRLKQILAVAVNTQAKF